MNKLFCSKVSHERYQIRYFTLGLHDGKFRPHVYMSYDKNVMSVKYCIPGQYALMKSPFEWMLVSKNLVAMGITGIVFFIITILCEFNFFCKAK